MRSRDGRGVFRSGLRRVDVRAALHLALIFAPLVSLLLFALYLFAAGELLELANYALDDRLTQLEQAWQSPDPDRQGVELAELARELALETGGFVVADAKGAVLAAGGERVASPLDGGRGSGVFGAIRIGGDDRLVATRELASGVRLALFVSSADFVRERDEVLQGFWWTLVAGVGLVGLLAIPASWLSLAPLRRATRVAESLDARALSTRIPTRETDDDVDRHIRVVNGLLDQIERGFARLEAFSQDVAHELRTPVHRILNASELLLLDAAVDGRAGSEARTIARAAEQMARLIDGLLILARSEQDALALRREPVDVARLCRTLAEMYEPACERAGVRLEVECEPAQVALDPSLFLRALGNLLDNALAHTPAGGAIRLRGAVERGDRDRVRLEVEDEGPGVPDAMRERLFERFARAPRAAPGSGVGLGLPIARTIARAHGGDLELAPVARSGPERAGTRAARAFRGARFVLWLPRVPADEEGDAERAAATPRSAHGLSEREPVAPPSAAPARPLGGAP
ncbi:MAG: ATP-binding protein [Myxococcota bacterium]